MEWNRGREEGKKDFIHWFLSLDQRPVLLNVILATLICKGKGGEENRGRGREGIGCRRIGRKGRMGLGGGDEGR